MVVSLPCPSALLPGGEPRLSSKEVSIEGMCRDAADRDHLHKLLRSNGDLRAFLEIDVQAISSMPQGLDLCTQPLSCP